MKTYLTSTLFFLSSILFSQPFGEVGTLVPSDGEDQDLFGQKIAMAGNFAFITAVGDRTQGSVYVFEYENQGWAEIQKLTPQTGDDGVDFGTSVSMTEEYAIVGFSGDDEFGNKSGSAIIYKNNGGTWVYDQKLLPDTAVYNDRFGYSVDVFGEYAIVGAPYESGNWNWGVVYIYHKETGGWELQQRVIASSSTYGDFFGGAVAITDDFAFVGADGVDHSGTNSGVVYVFERTNNTWGEVAILSPSDAKVGYNFGYGLDVSGNTLVISAPEAGETYAHYGFAYVFENQNGTWVETQKIEASDQEDKDDFGVSVSVSCDYLVVGARYNEEGGFNNGAAYFFKKESNSWVESAKAMGFEGGGLMGMATAISCDKALVGASHNSVNGSNSGLVYSYIDTTETGITNLVNQDLLLTIFPNPNNGEFTINTKGLLGKSLKILSVSGKLVDQLTIQKETTFYQPHNLSKGMYFLQVENGTSMLNIKMIVQ